MKKIIIASTLCAIWAVFPTFNNAQTMTPTHTKTPTKSPTPTYAVPCSGYMNFGNTLIPPSASNFGPNLIVASREYLSEPATVLSVTGDFFGGQVNFGIYSDNGNDYPEALAASLTGIPVVTGVSTYDMTPTVLPAGYYWLAVLGDSSGYPLTGDIPDSTWPSYSASSSILNGIFPAGASPLRRRLGIHVNYCLGDGTPTYTVTTTYTVIPTFTPTQPTSPTATFTFTQTKTNSFTPTVTRTFTFTGTPTATPTGTWLTHTPTPTWYFDPTPSGTRTPTITRTPTYTKTFTQTFTPTVSYTPSGPCTYCSATPTGTFTFTPTVSYTPSGPCTYCSATPTNTVNVTFTPTPGMTCGEWFGQPYQGPSGSPAAGQINALKIVLDQGRTVANLYCFLLAGGQIQVGLYSDTAGAPGTLLAESSVATVGPGPRWINEMTGLYLPAGTYWLAFIAGGGVVWGTLPPTIYPGYQSTFVGTALPSDFPAGTTGTQSWCLAVNCSVCPLTPSPTITPTETLTDTPTGTLTPSLTPTTGFTFDPTPSGTRTPTITRTPTYTQTFTQSFTPTVSYTPSAPCTYCSATPTGTFTFTPSTTFTPSPTWTGSPGAPTSTSTRTNTPTNTFTYTRTFTPTVTYTPSSPCTYCTSTPTETAGIPAPPINLDGVVVAEALSYPNPSRDGTATLYYEVSGDTTGVTSLGRAPAGAWDPSIRVTLSLYTQSGLKLWGYSQAGAKVGANTYPWNGHDAGGIPVANGLYWFKATVASPGGASSSRTSPVLILK